MTFQKSAKHQTTFVWDLFILTACLMKYCFGEQFSNPFESVPCTRSGSALLGVAIAMSRSIFTVRQVLLESQRHHQNFIDIIKFIINTWGGACVKLIIEIGGRCIKNP